MTKAEWGKLDIKYLEAENDRLTTQVAVLRMCCVDLKRIIDATCKEHNLTSFGRADAILRNDIPKILRGTKCAKE